MTPNLKVVLDADSGMADELLTAGRRDLIAYTIEWDAATETRTLTATLDVQSEYGWLLLNGLSFRPGFISVEYRAQPDAA